MKPERKLRFHKDGCIKGMDIAKNYACYACVNFEKDLQYTMHKSIWAQCRLLGVARVLARMHPAVGEGGYHK